MLEKLGFMGQPVTGTSAERFILKSKASATYKHKFKEIKCSAAAVSVYCGRCYVRKHYIKPLQPCGTCNEAERVLNFMLTHHHQDHHHK